MYTQHLTDHSHLIENEPPRAGVAELVDVADSKSADSDIVRVRVSPSAPFNSYNFSQIASNKLKNTIKLT